MGPRPLPLHLTTALCVWLSLPIGWQRLKNGSANSNPALSPKLAASLAKILQNPQLQNRTTPSEPNPDFDAALASEAARRTRAFIKGVQRYQKSPIRRDVPSATVIAQIGNVLLRDYNPAEPTAPIVLVIPSLINRFDILDLDHQQSFLRSVTKAGFRPLVVDWDVPDDEESTFDIGHYVTERLVPLLDNVTQKPVHIMGYCMGGLLALALATLRPNLTKTLALLATPWDFHKPDTSIASLLHGLTYDHKTTTAFNSPLAIDALQAFFASLQPLQALKKFSDFATLGDSPENKAEERRFVLLEDWLNDGVPLSAPAARECVQDWYDKNLPGLLQWKVGGKLIDPRLITVPTYCMVPGSDKIVPPESALALTKLLPHNSLHEPMIGHIGLMASTRAPHQVWVPFLRWMAEHR